MPTEDPPNEKITKALEALTTRYGGPTPALVIEVARDPDHDLHDYFEWDDTVAAAQYRLYQARKLIQSVQMFVTFQDHTIACPVYLRDPSKAPNEQGYVPALSLMNERELAILALRREIDRVESAFTRARGVAVVLGIEQSWGKVTRRSLMQLTNLLTQLRGPEAH